MMSDELEWPDYMGIIVMYEHHCEYRTDILTSIDLRTLEDMGFNLVGMYPSKDFHGLLNTPVIVVLLESTWGTIEGEE